MKEFVRILWILLIQYIACWLAGWVTSVTLFTLGLVIIWQGIFAGVNQIIQRRNNTHSKKDDTLVKLLVLSVLALFSPLLSVLLFCGFSVYRVCLIGGITVGETPFKEQFIFHSEYLGQPDTDSPTAGLSNPATGLPMCGVVDSSGNAYGSSIITDGNYYK